MSDKPAAVRVTLPGASVSTHEGRARSFLVLATVAAVGTAVRLLRWTTPVRIRKNSRAFVVSYLIDELDYRFWASKALYFLKFGNLVAFGTAERPRPGCGF